MHNSCSFIGNLGADPEIRSFQSGGRVCNFRIAVSERWKDKDGQQQERTEWVPVTIYSDGLIGVVERFLRKGSKIFVRGKWRTRKWQDRDGSDRYSTECVLQGPGSELEMLDGKAADNRGERKQSYASESADQSQHDDLETDIPF